MYNVSKNSLRERLKIYKKNMSVVLVLERLKIYKKNMNAARENTLKYKNIMQFIGRLPCRLS